MTKKYDIIIFGHAQRLMFNGVNFGHVPMLSFVGVKKCWSCSNQNLVILFWSSELTSVFLVGQTKEKVGKGIGVFEISGNYAFLQLKDEYYCVCCNTIPSVGSQTASQV